MKSLLLDTDDLDVAEAVVSTFFGPIRMEAEDGDKPSSACMMRSLVGSTSVDEAEFGFTFRYTMNPPDKVLLARIHSGAMERETTHGPPEFFGPDTVGAFGAGQADAIIGTCHRGRWDTYLIDYKYLKQVAVSADGGDVRLTGSVPVSEAANRHLVAAMDYFRDSIAVNPEIATNQFIAGTAQRYLAASILATYPNTVRADATSEHRRDGSEVLLRRAMAFIDENAQTDICLNDIADAVNMSPRAVQYMFRRHRDCTPMQYARRIRLQYAHLDLLGGDPTSTSVSGIARRWGFAHTGRFAASYRMVYGQSPHTTLRA
jgi:AraC-like DNA-binding protein